MNRLEIAVSLYSRNIGDGLSVEGAFALADSILKHHQSTNKIETHKEQTENKLSKLLDANLNWAADKDDWVWLQASEILKKCGQPKPSNLDSARVGIFIRSKNGNLSKRVTGRKLIFCPPFK